MGRLAVLVCVTAVAVGVVDGPVVTVAAADVPGQVVVSSDGLVPTVRYHGASRYETAALMAQDRFDGASTVLLARGDLFPDSLASGFLAGFEGAPLLLTRSDSLAGEAQQALDTLQPTKVVLLGGEAAVSSEVEANLEAQGFDVDRVAGMTRYETAAKLATLPGTTVGTLDGQRTAIVASGEAFPDALVASALSYARGWPLLLTGASALPEVTRATLDQLDIDRVLVPGGTAAVATAVTDAIEHEGIAVTRLAGDNRVETALAVASFAVEQAGFDRRRVNLATGADFPDGLSMGAVAGADDAPVLLTQNADAMGSDALGAYLEAIRADTCARGLRIAGGPAAVSDRLAAEVRELISEPGACSGALDGPDGAVQAGTQTTLTFTASGQTGQPVPDAEVDFAVYRDPEGGAQTAPVETATATTGEDGSATFSYVGPAGPATDVVVACIDADGDGCATSSDGVTLDGDDPSVASSRVEWTGQACSDDAQEDDDTPQDARAATSGKPVALIACPGDDDWTSIDVSLGGVVRVELAGPRAPELTIDIHRPDGTLAASGSETVELPVTEESDVGTHTIRVGDAQGDAVDYSITVTTSVNCPADDSFEDNDTEETAVAVTGGQSMGAVICPGDDADWFELAGMAAGDTARIDLVPHTGTGEGSIRLTNDDLVGPLGAEPVTLHANVQESGVVGVKIALDSESSEGRAYTLTITDVGEVDCEGDTDPEPNDARAAAAAITPGEPVAGTVCQRDHNDWFSVQAVPGDTVAADVVFDQGTSHIIDLVDPSGTIVDRDAFLGPEDDFSPDVSAQVQDDEAGTWTIHVWGFSSTYTLTAEVGPADCASDDGFESNDSRSEAFALTSGVSVPPHVCALDWIDWFAIDASEGQTIEVQYGSGDAEVDVHAGLVAPDGTFLDVTDPGGGFTYTVQEGQDGTFGIFVVASSQNDDFLTDYDLTVTVTS